jgi:hypothetical protein
MDSKFLQKLIILSLLSLICSVNYAQPVDISTDLSGSLTIHSLNDLGSFRQVTIQAPGTPSYTNGTPEWSFRGSSGFAGDVWRPNVSNTAMSALNTTIRTSAAGSARYQTTGGGGNGLLPGSSPGVTANYYYTFNITESNDPGATVGKVMSVLETSYNPATISGAAVSFTAANGAYGTTTVSLSSLPTLSSGENLFIRYTINGYTTSTVAQVTPSGSTGTATIQAFSSGSNVSFYFFTSNQSLSTIQTEVTNNGEYSCDVLTLKMLDNSGAFYTYTQPGNILIKASSGTALGSYSTLKTAFDSINSGYHKGVITIGVTGATTETATAQLNESGLGGASYSSIEIRSAGGTKRTISGAISNAPLVTMNGADHVKIDGLRSGGNLLEFENTTRNGANTCTFKFFNDACADSIWNCDIKGADTVLSNTAATILIGDAKSSGVGNDSIGIMNCKVGTSSGNSPVTAIQLNNTTSSTSNDYIHIYGDSIFDFFASASISRGVYIQAGVSNAIISACSFYQTASRIFSSAIGSMELIRITAGNGHSILNNYLGGNTSFCAGSKLTIASGILLPMALTVGTTTTTSVQGNTISNFQYTSTTTSAFQAAVLITGGNVDFGTTTGNTIGSMAATGNIQINSNAASGTPGYAALLAQGNTTTNAVKVHNSIIGGITIANTFSYPLSMRGIYMLSSNTATYSDSANTVGSQTIASSINNTTGSVNVGILAGVLGSASVTRVVDNKVQNLTTSGTLPGQQCIGIFVGQSTLGSTYVVKGNTVRTLRHTGANANTGGFSSVIGVISVNITSSGTQTIQGNTVYDLMNSSATGNTVVTGIYFSGSNSTTHSISGNHVHSLRLGTSSNSGVINGLHSGDGRSNWFNNIVRLGTDTSGTSITTGYNINGIYDETDTNNYYHNSVYISGTGVSSSSNTHAFNSLVTTTIRSFRNNIFVNARSNSSGLAVNYGMKMGGTSANPTGLSQDYNDIYASGTGGKLGIYNTTDYTTLSTWRSATGKDSNSINVDPAFASSTDLTPSNVYVHNGAVAAITNIDFNNATRLSPPDMGAIEFLINLRSSTGDLNGTPVSLSGSDWVHIQDGSGNLVMSINPNGNNLGSTSWGVRISGASGLRTDSTKETGFFGYYADRNFYITPTNQPSSNVTVRLYLKASEAQEVIDSVFNKYGYVIDADSIEISHWSYAGSIDLDPQNNEVADSLSFIAAATSVFSNDYALTFNTNHFSEFGLSHNPHHNTVPLAVTLLSFDATLNNHTVQLHWATASEINHSQFNIEKSDNLYNWKTISTQKAQGSPNSLTNYSSQDMLTNEDVSTVYYRLKIVDRNGAYTYSDIKSIVRSKTHSTFTFNPNPVNDVLNITSGKENAGLVEIIDMSGRVVIQQNIQNTGSCQINLSGLPKGFYFIRYQTSSELIQERFLKN